jgi:hypothetical protein
MNTDFESIRWSAPKAAALMVFVVVLFVVSGAFDNDAGELTAGGWLLSIVIGGIAAAVAFVTVRAIRSPRPH